MWSMCSHGSICPNLAEYERKRWMDDEAWGRTPMKPPCWQGMGELTEDAELRALVDMRHGRTFRRARRADLNVVWIESVVSNGLKSPSLRHVRDPPWGGSYLEREGRTGQRFLAWRASQYRARTPSTGSPKPSVGRPRVEIERNSSS